MFVCCFVVVVVFVVVVLFLFCLSELYWHNFLTAFRVAVPSWLTGK